ncbi:hypothetical protein [Parvibaculum sp.]|uniref:hypothetical protein n=1 Tax=Parvibaculum sp. TaxID=2024848 RepID=UPI00320CE964
MRLQRINGWFYAALCVIAALPILTIAYPPIVDFPNHAARLHIACHAADYAGMYEYRLGVIPNLAIDLINLPLCGLVTPERVVLATIALAQLSICASVWFIRKRLFGENDALVLVAPALFLNLVTTMGYANYLVGIAILFWMMFFLLSRPQASWLALLAIGTLGGIAIFFSHIFALMFAMVAMCGWLWHGRFAGMGWRGAALAGLSTVGMFIIPLALVPLAAGSGETGFGVGLSPWSKIRAVLSPLYTNNITLDIIAAVIWSSAMIILLRARAFVVAPAMRGALLALLVACIFLPGRLLDAVDIDARLFTSFIFLALASARLEMQARAREVVAALALGTLVLHTALAILIWRPMSAQVAEWRAASLVLPARASVLTVEATRGPLMYTTTRMSYAHLMSYATIDRHIFNPYEFTGKGMQPMVAVGAYEPLDTPVGVPLKPDIARLTFGPPSPTPKWLALMEQRNMQYTIEWGARFPYIVYFHFGKAPNFDPRRLRLMTQGSFFSVLVPKDSAIAHADR